MSHAHDADGEGNFFYELCVVANAHPAFKAILMPHLSDEQKAVLKPAVPMI